MDSQLSVARALASTTPIALSVLPVLQRALAEVQQRALLAPERMLRLQHLRVHCNDAVDQWHVSLLAAHRRIDAVLGCYNIYQISAVHYSSASNWAHKC